MTDANKTELKIMTDTEQEVHIFLGKGRITENPNYPVGEIHAFIFYLRQDKNSGYDFDNAEELINEIGFDQVELSKAGKLDPSRLTEKNRNPYGSALNTGSSIVIYNDPIDS